MKRSTTFAQRVIAAGEMSSVFDVLVKELENGIETSTLHWDELKAATSDRRKHQALLKNRGFTEMDYSHLLKHLRKDMQTCDVLSHGKTIFRACFGDKCLPAYCPGFEGKRLDLLAIADAAGELWVFGDCKFGLKPGTWGLFLDEEHFRAEVNDKFENVETHFKRMGERFIRGRLIVVTTNAYPQCFNLFKRLELGKTPPIIVKKRYSLQTVKTIAGYLRKWGR